MNLQKCWRKQNDPDEKAKWPKKLPDEIKTANKELALNSARMRDKAVMKIIYTALQKVLMITDFNILKDTDTNKIRE